MATDPLETLLHLVVDRLRNDEALRDALRSALVRLLESPAPTSTEPQPAPQTPIAAEPRPAVAATLAGPTEILPPLTFHQKPDRGAATSIAAGEAPSVAPSAFDLKLMADRFAIKRDGCEWHIERRRLMQRPEIDFDSEVGPRDRAVMDRARALPGGCWMWMCRPESPTPEPQLMETAARSYDNLSRATLLVRNIFEDEKLSGRHEESALGLLAEALSATRVVLERIDAVDGDHKQTFRWLKEQTQARGVFIERYMKLDDPADPDDWNDLSDRIGAIQQRVQTTQTSAQQQKQLLNAIRFHCQKLPAAQRDESGVHWAKIIAACSQLVGAKTPASNTQLRDLLVPVIDLLPGDQPVTPEFEQVLRSIDAYVASREAETPEPAAPAASADVLGVRGALSGKSVVVIGGVARPAAREKLRVAFDLADVYWPETREHESHYHFESLVHKKDVALVLLAIRWSGHAFGEIKAFCESADKPLVYLPAGYNPNSVAHEIMTQAGKRLGLAAQ
jgi:hypothetical protein